MIYATSVVMGSCVLAMGCGAGSAAQAIRTDAPTAAQAVGEAECRDVNKGGEPLVVDWRPEQRGDLEVAMKDGIVIVSYSCQGIKLLTDCKLDGDYGFIGMTRREQVVRLRNADELRANLPLSGVKLGSELERGMALEIAMMMVRKKRTTWSAPAKEELKGSCEGATHFVRCAIVGAFAMSTGSDAKVRAAAEIFGAGTLVHGNHGAHGHLSPPRRGVHQPADGLALRHDGRNVPRLLVPLRRHPMLRSITLT